MILGEGDDVSEHQCQLVYDWGKGLIALVRTLGIHFLPLKKKKSKAKKVLKKTLLE